MKTKVIITFILILILCGVNQVRAGIVYSNSIVEFGVEYTIQTDKAVYNLGEDVEMLFKITNISDEEVLIYCSQDPELNLQVESGGVPIWMKIQSWYLFSPGIELLAGESVEITHTWDMKDDYENLVGQGIYDVVGVMYNAPWNDFNKGEPIPTEVKLPITIIPEPSTLFLLVLGGLLLRKKL